MTSRFARNLGSMGSAQIATRITRLLTTIILTRLLTPNDYGLAAVVLTVYELVALFTRNGISAKVVQASEADVPELARTAYTLTWIVCGALVLVQALLAMPIAWFYQDARLALPIALMGLIYLATPLSNIQGAFMQREGRLGRIALTGAVQMIADNALTAIFALCGMGMWAIILPKLLVAPIWTIGLRTGHAWRPHGGFSLVGWQDIARFSRDVVGVELMTTLQANVDNLIVGAFLGVQALGLYYFAFNAGLGITLGLVNAFGAAVYPHLCEVRQDPVALSRRYRATLRTMGKIVVPLILAQALLAPIYVPIVFGAKWVPAIPVMMLICLSALPRPFAATCSQLLKAIGRPAIELRWQAALTALLIAGLLLGTTAGIQGVAVAVLAVQATVLTVYVIRAPRPFLTDTSASPFQVVTTEADFLALAPEWDALWARADRPFLSRGFAWCLAGWRSTGKPRGRRLRIVTMREEGRIVLIWPMTVRRRLFLTAAAALGPESTEYDPILVEAGPDAARRIREAWDFVRQDAGIDVVTIPFARQDSDAHAVLSTHAGVARTHTLPAPEAHFGASWDAYWRTRSANLRNGLTRRRKRLAEQGTVTSAWVEDDAEFETLLDWALTRKRDWMRRTGLANDFIATTEYRDFLLALWRQPTAMGRLAMLALRVNGVPVAVKIGCLDGTRLEGFITTYDRAWSTYSPGQIILADCLAWCQANGLYYDFRIGDEAYKRDWSTGVCMATTLTLATNALGALLIQAGTLAERAQALRAHVQAWVPAALHARVKALARFFAGRRACQEA